jgi:Domain of unknown function (DUF4276)
VNRLAVFTEGPTDQLFMDWFVREFAGARGLVIEHCHARGGSTTRRRTRIVRAIASNPETRFYVLIVDCSGDGGVKSKIVQEYNNLARVGYQRIIGLQDAPRPRSGIERLRQGLLNDIPQQPVPVAFFLAIMEIEAWFLSEHTHFSRIDALLTPTTIRERLGFDPSTEDMSLRDRPAQDLNDAYSIVGRRYHKGQGAQQTVYVLDCDRIGTDMAESIPDLGRLVEAIGNWMELPPVPLPDSDNHVSGPSA